MLDPKTRDFVQQGVSILAASRTAGNTPCVSRAAGCRVLDDQRLLVYLPTSCSQEVLEAINATAAIAVVFSEPKSHKSIQIKGSDAGLGNQRPEAAELEAYSDAFTAELVSLGFSRTMAEALVRIDAADITPILFTPTSIFEQTPGPRAGEPLVAVQ